MTRSAGKRKTLRERAEAYSKRRPVPTDREIGLFDGYIAGYRAAKRKQGAK